MKRKVNIKKGIPSKGFLFYSPHISSRTVKIPSFTE